MKKENTMAENALPTGWRTTTLGEVVELVSEKISCNNVDIKKYISTENMLPYKGGVKLAATIPSNGNCSSFEIGDVLFSNIRTYFQKVWLASFKGGSSNDVIIFRPKIKDELNKDYLYYMICNDRFIDYTVLTAKGTKMPRGDKDAIKQYSLFLPSLKEQKAIAKVLSSFDDKIELLQEQNKTLEETAQTIFKEWFGKYQVGDKLPEGWTVGSLGDVAYLKSGYAFKSIDFTDISKMGVLKIKDLKGNGKIDISNISCVSENLNKIQRVNYFKLSEGDIVLAMSGNTIGKIGVVPIHENEIYLNQRVGKLFFKDAAFKYFIYYFLMSNQYEKKILSMGYGSAQPNINPLQIECIKIIFPSDDFKKDFIIIVKPMFEKILYNTSHLESLKKTRDQLLSKLMSGVLRVNNVY